jgi:hypothetical protein
MSDDDKPEVRDDAPADETVVPREDSGNGEEDFSPFDEVDEDFKPGPMHLEMGSDGLPRQIDQTAESDIPALSKETLVCMGDYSKFVIRDRWGSIVAEFEPTEVDRSPTGMWRVKTSVALERAKLALERERKASKDKGGKPEEGAHHDEYLLAALAAKFVSTHDGYGVQAPPHSDQWFTVDPVRPRCVHYARQKVSMPENAQHKLYARLCSARRTTEGAFMSVRDSGMWACDMRNPRHLGSELQLDEFDAKKIQEGANRTHLNVFDSVTSEGIFDGPEQKETH